MPFVATGESEPYEVAGSVEGLHAADAPVVVGDEIVVPHFDGLLEWRDRTTGGVVRSVDLETTVHFARLIRGDLVVGASDPDSQGSNGDVLFVLDPATGSSRWELTHPQTFGAPVEVADRWWFKGNDEIVTVDPATRTVTSFSIASGTRTPIVVNERVVIVHDGQDSLESVLSVYDAETQQLLGEQTIGVLADQPAVADGLVWVSVRDRVDNVQKMLLIDIDPLEVVDQIPLVDAFDASEVFGQVWVQQIGDTQAITVVDPASREIVDQLRFEGSVLDLTVFDGGVVVSELIGEVDARYTIYDENRTELAVIDLPGRPQQLTVTDTAIWVGVSSPFSLMKITR
ncbi:MAG: hypothetical protein RIB98_17065 [Acidimicrobiales bacterium]